MDFLLEHLITLGKNLITLGFTWKFRENYEGHTFRQWQLWQYFLQQLNQLQYLHFAKNSTSLLDEQLTWYHLNHLQRDELRRTGEFFGGETIVFCATETTSERISSVYFQNAEDADSFMACEVTRKSARRNFLATDEAVLFFLHLWIPWRDSKGQLSSPHCSTGLVQKEAAGSSESFSEGQAGTIGQN